jgi:hypothetical protein
MGNLLDIRSPTRDITVPIVSPATRGADSGNVAHDVDVHVDVDADLNICWHNIPPKTSVYWAYSGISDRNSYYFMGDSMAVEACYSSGHSRFTLANGSYIDFAEMRQYTLQPGRTRDIRRITSDQFSALRERYLASLEARSCYWCLDCKTGYVLYSPAIQSILDRALAEGTTITISQCYSYDIDPFRETQRNNYTGKTRRVARVTRGSNTKPIYGPYLVKIPACAVPPVAPTEPCVGPTDLDSGLDASCIYSQQYEIHIDDVDVGTAEAEAEADADADADAEAEADAEADDCIYQADSTTLHSTAPQNL